MVVAILEHLMTTICFAVFAGPVIDQNLAECVLNGLISIGTCMICKWKTSPKEWPQENLEKMPS